jgi:hypothetical protein
MVEPHRRVPPAEPILAVGTVRMGFGNVYLP